MPSRKPRSPAAPRPSGQGGFLLSKIHHLSRRLLARKLKARGVDELNPGQGRILFALWQGDGITIGALAERTALQKSTLTHMLDRLEADGMVRREYPPDDRRTVRVVLAPRVRAMLDTFGEVSQEMAAVFYAGLSQAEIATFEATLARIYQNLRAAE